MDEPSSATTRPTVGVAVAGFGWMGRAHTHGYLRVLHHFPDLPVAPRLTLVADDVPGRAEEAAARYGFARATTDWRQIAADPEVAAVSIAAPNFLHREIGVAMAEAGKHIWIEKPVGLTAQDARAVADAVRSAGVRSAVGFNYRCAPAVASAKQLVSSGAIGEVTSARFWLLSDYAAHPEGALTWRYGRAQGGSGVLGDLASHGVDLLRHLLGEVESVVADTAIFVPERAQPTGATAGHQRATGGKLGPVENEDFVSALLRLSSGVRCSLEASRVAVGEQNNYGFQIRGTRGLVAWDFRRMGELAVSSGSDYQDQPVALRYVGPGDGHTAAFQPGSAIPLGYDDLKVIEAAAFLTSIATGEAEVATVDDALAAAEILDAMVASVESGRWEPVGG